MENLTRRKNKISINPRSSGIQPDNWRNVNKVVEEDAIETNFNQAIFRLSYKCKLRKNNGSYYSVNYERETECSNPVLLTTLLSKHSKILLFKNCILS